MCLAHDDGPEPERRLADVVSDLIAPSSTTSQTQLLTMLAQMLHDLKGPLCNIVGFSDILREGHAGALSAGQSALVKRIDSTACFALELVGELSDAVRLKQSNLEKRPVDLDEHVEEAIARNAAVAVRGQVRLEAVLSLDAPLVPADPLSIGRLLDNLLINAIKFTRPGGDVRVRVRASGTGAVVEVSDRGPGMTSTASRQDWPAKPRSTGLGLLISRAIVDRLGGRLWARRRRGGGTSVCFWLPGSPPAPGA